MTSKGKKSPKAAAPAPPPASPASPIARGLRGLVLGQVIGATFGRFLKLIAAIVLGAAGVFLTVAWQTGPERMVNAARDRKLTARADGRIVESWLAVELDPKAMGRKTRWRAFAKASPCAVVEFGGDWGAPRRRAFCGNQFKFHDDYTLYDLREMAPKIPFAWARDESGFILPEIRISPAAREWLTSHPAQWLLPNDPPAATAMEGLRQQLDRPVDAAIAGWSASDAFPLALDPKHPEAAMPAGVLQTRLSPNWIVCFMIAIPGLLLWYEGMAMLFGDLPRYVGYALVALGLVALPWWAEAFPRYLRYLNRDFAGVIEDMFGDIDRLGRLVASSPADATLAGGERLVWNAKTGFYADTFGQFQYSRPGSALKPDDAVVALASAITDQVRTLPETERVELFRRLERDKTKELRRAGVVFLPAAREAILGGADGAEDSGDQVRKAAADFLHAWFTQPMELMNPRDPGHAGVIKMYAVLADLPIPSIAMSARTISGLPEK